MDYRQPSKEKANEAYLRAIGKLNDRPYNEEQIEQKTLFLIICEGKNTERYYFESFPVPSKTIKVIGGCGSKTSLVDYAIQLSKEAEYSDREIWCVYDFDIKPDEALTQPEDFNSSIEKALANGLKVAWSNDAFELWFLLHFQELTSALTRDEIDPILKDKWQVERMRDAKTAEFCMDHYKRHLTLTTSNQKLAIRRAKKLHDGYGGRTDYAKLVPCTTVYLLVEELNKNIKA